METNSDGTVVQRPSYLVSAEPTERPTGIDVDDIKLDLSHEFSLVASSSEENELQSKDHVQVCLRIRPFTPSEKESDSQGCIYVQDSTTVLLKDPQSLAGRLSEKCCGQMAQKFSFSKVFGPETTQKEFFEGSIMQLVKDFLKGENRLIFTYGVTNSGKTYTFQGTEENTGILPRTMNMLFNNIQDKLYEKMDLKPHRCRDYLRLSSDQVKEEVAIKNALLRQIKEVALQNGSCDTLYGSWNSVNVSDFEDSKDFEQPSLNVDNTVKFSVWVSFFEIYNEFIYDLFVPVSNDKYQKRKMLRLSQDVKGCSFIKDLQWIHVSDSREAYRLLKLGLKHRSFASTKLNTASSRSHSIFTIRTLQIEDSEVPHVTGVSELSLCDLAGSERSMKTQNEGERLRETGNINTSLLTLGKCINALRNSQKSKLQQHVPFRESKLTHYFQSFFNGKGKIYMIVNISQCCSAYDETFSVLKFAAVAQKVFVADILNFSQEKPFGQTKSSRDTSFIANNADTKMLQMKRTTIEWERSLEDVIEDEDLVENPDEAQDDHNMEEADMTFKEEKSFSKEEYSKLLSLIEDLKNKLINEKKEKLTLELKIRDEVTQEFTQYLAQREADFKESLLQEREMLEENSERRMAIFKDLVGDCETSREEPMDETCTVKVESKESDNFVGIEDVIDSLQDDITDIKKQAEIAHSFIASLADPQEAIACLEQKYNQATAELAKIQEEFAKVQEELVKTQEELKRENKSEMTDCKISVHELENANKKIVAQNQRIQELMNIIDQKEETINKLQNLVSHMEDTFKGCDETLFTIKKEISKLNSTENVEAIQIEKDKKRISSGRKRSFEDSLLQQEELPTKKGSVNSAILPDEQKETRDLQQGISEKEADIRDLQEENEGLKKKLLVMEKNLLNEKATKEELNQQLTSSLQDLACSKEKISVLSVEIQQIRSDYENAISELHAQKTINQEQEDKVMELLKEIATTRQNITNKVAQIKIMQTEIDKLHMLDSVPQTLEEELQNLNDPLKDYPVNLSNTQSNLDAENYSVNTQVEESSVECFRRKSSFHCSIEAIWKECKAMVKISSNKSNQIQELEQQIEKLYQEVRDIKEENNQLKLNISENMNQDNLLKEKENTIKQLKEELEGKIIRLAVEEQHVVESEKKISEFTQQITSLTKKIKELETILATKKDTDNHLTILEKVVLEKESLILKLEGNLKEFEENLKNSSKNAKELSDKEAELKEEVIQLKNNLQNVNNSLQIKDKENENNSQEIVKLKEELSANSALIHKLKEDLQRKEEDHVDLKEKFADAKKQIEQVQKEISIMRDQEKLLRNKVNELEKIKNQFSQELDIKQRTIHQLKEQLSNQNSEEILQQCQNIHKDLDIKEKIIEGMRVTMEEQEQTQVEMEEMLANRSEEVVMLTSELEEWKEKYKNLETKIRDQRPQEENQSNKENTDVLSEKLNHLQEQLQESEQKHQDDRKKWLEEKMMLITQAKEAETHRNREMKKYVEDRARCLQLHSEVERLTAQLANKDDDLQKWREERDQLVSALEIQLKTLVSRNIQKDNEIEQLKKITSEDPGKDYKHTIKELKTMLDEKENTIKKLKDLNHSEKSKEVIALTDAEMNTGKQLSPNIQEKQVTDNKSGNAIPPDSDTVKREMSSVPCPSDEISMAEIEDGSGIALDSSEVSTDNEHVTRFPKSELEIRFTPLQPNKMSVKHLGSLVPVTVKISKPKKRKSSEMEENFVKHENKKNVTTPRTKLPDSYGCNSIKKEPKVSTMLSSKKAYSLRNQASTLSPKSSIKKKDGTLQKFGDFLQHSPTILQSKAKKLMEKMSPSKPIGPEKGNENGSRPKRTKRKLYTSEISSPLDITGQVIFMDQKEKESDHQILKRRLRTRTAK
ncbi:kinesin-like protein KIF20B isoform X1 [Monodelphis domestica]|uniref:kinesin-like protein KIF20B isoform X1 n=1 Tax=Monodelphis domestica TaxID=13616 RepID=UPI0007B41E23|nr:kinesin-like protein KIF20B isoform X1 [Monodelphis domestica]XP_016283510.1 kinesin-like protein KIF20B isoform X1 [Monodelphis domestica]